MTVFVIVNDLQSLLRTDTYLINGAAKLVFLSFEDSFDHSSRPFLLICCGVRNGYLMANRGRCSNKKCFRFVFPSLRGVTGQLVRRHGDINGVNSKVSTAVVCDLAVDSILEKYQKKLGIELMTHSSHGKSREYLWDLAGKYPQPVQTSAWGCIGRW